MSVGRRLAAARVERGLGVDDVSRATRIRVPIVQAIESDDFTAAGPAVYARGHIRSIATLLGLDPAPLLTEYDAEHGGGPAAAAALTPATWERVDRAAARADRRAPRWLGAAVVTSGVLVGLLAIGLVTEEQLPDQVVVAGPSSAPSDTPSAAAGASAGPDAGAPAAPPADVPAEDAAPGGVRGSGSGDRAGSGAGAATPVPVRVTARGGRSWLEVTDSRGEQVFAGVLEAGAAKEFDAPSGLRLVIGDARAVRLEVGGRAVPVPGGWGEVARLRVRPGGTVTPG